MNFREELAAWVTQQNQTTKLKRKESLAAFLAVRTNVIEAMTAGYALKTIWEHMHETGRVPFRYETFLKHVRRHITNASVESVNSYSKRQTKDDNKSGATTTSELRKREASPAGGFSFNATPKKEDLC